jgi:uncharacterized damage-inducible protein DinB
MKNEHAEKTPEILAIPYILHPIPEIASALWSFQDARRRTLGLLAQIKPERLDQLPADGGSTIGSILYHMALIEADWLYTEILEQEIPTDIETLLPVPHRDEHGILGQFTGEGMEQQLGRMKLVRNRLLEAIESIDLANFRRLRLLPEYHVSAAWVIHHLTQHEAEHRGQIGEVLRTL